jgi:HD-like signal output (HDOD) protein/CheY-like chemotaxis protein
MNAMNTPPTKLRVLFVDDDVSLLNALRRTLHSMRAEWTMTFVESGERALAHLDEHGADVLVSDMRMPGMDGAQLLAEVSRRHPGVIRFVLSGFANNEIVTRAVATSHQYLDKPCNPELLIDAVRRSLALRNLLQDERLRGFVTGLRTLPSRLDVYEKFIAEIDRPAATTATIAAVIESDVALAAKVLKMANSAYFAVPAHVTECRQAVQLLGLDTLRGVIALSSFLAEFADTPDLAQAVERLGRRSLEIGMLARDIMAAEGGDRDACSQACTAGLLAHVGTLLLLANHPDAFRTAGRICDDDGISIVVAERMVLGATHAELGAYLLGLWGFPDPVVEAVAYHHVPADLGSAKFCTASAVHAAQAVVCDSCFTDKDGAPIHAHLDVAYLRALDKVTRIPHWRQLFTQRPTDGGQP